MDLQELSKAADNNFQDFLFYDIEVFAHDSLVVFKDIDKNTVAEYQHKDFHKIEGLIEGKVLVGYNNYYYDDIVLSSMIQGDTQKRIKQVNDILIYSDDHPLVPLNTSIFSLDCFQQINVAKSSLKKIEANLGLSIEESKVPFDIDRKLTDKELEETIKYCKHDVDATIDIFKLRWFSYFVPKLNIVSMLEPKLQSMAIRWNTTTVSAQLLISSCTHYPKWRYFRLDRNDAFTRGDLLEKVPEYVVDIWREAAKNHNNPDAKFVKKYSYYKNQCKFEFGLGGLHGVSSMEKQTWHDVKLLDVTSLYPNLIINIRALGSATDKYKEIVDQRVKIKRSDKILSNALKLVINSTYGLLKNQYSKLYNPNAALSVCMLGQIVLFDLCERLALAGYKLINVNTDGVAFTGSVDDKYFQAIKSEWEQTYNLELELSEFDTWIQKDVNNYIAVDKHDNIKVKGTDVNFYSDPTDFGEDVDLLHLFAGPNWTGTFTNGIVDKCIVENLVNGTPVTSTIIANLDKPILFQYILSPGRTYVSTIDEHGNEYQRVNRVFACRDDVEGKVTLKKLKPIEGYKEMDSNERFERAQYFPNAPKNMYVFNGELGSFDNFKNIVDIDFYAELARKKLENFWINVN